MAGRRAGTKFGIARAKRMAVLPGYGDGGDPSRISGGLQVPKQRHCGLTGVLVRRAISVNWFGQRREAFRYCGMVVEGFCVC